MVIKINKFLARYRFLVGIYDQLVFSYHFICDYLNFLYKHLKNLFESNPKRILIIMTFGIGDIIRTTPAIQKLKSKYPQAQINYLTQGQFWPLLEHNPFLKKLFAQEDKEGVISQSYDLVINLQLFDNSPFVKELIRQIKFKKILGSHFDKKGRYRHIEDLFARNWVEKFCHTALVHYSHRDVEATKIYLPEDWVGRLNELRQKFGIDKDKVYIGINLGANDTSGAKLRFRNYSVKFLKKMIETLITSYGIILTGRSDERMPPEKEELDKLISVFPEIINLIDKINLEELILIVKGCQCYISSDTGPLHIAKALGVPFVALFGQSSGKKEIGPYRFTDRYSTLQSDLGCSPCGWRIKQECIDNKRALCLEGFSIGRITKEVNRLLQIIR